MLICKGIDAAELRPRKPCLLEKSASEEDTNEKAKHKYEVIDLIGLLKAGMRSVRHHTFGWHRDDLDGTKESLYSAPRVG